MTTAPSQPAIAVSGLRKSFGDQVVLDSIDLDVPEGTIFALLGTNGAGKTTTVQILSTLIGADGGQVRVAGHDVARDPDSVRAAIGVTGQFSAVDNLLTEGTPDELKRLIPGGHIRLRFADARGLGSAAHLLGEVLRDDVALTLHVPSDGSLRSLKTLLDRLDDESIEVDELTVHTPDLDDVFLALTGQPDKEKETVR
jgi:ABC-type iron transport system FetAB ATPase subunit